MFAFVSHRPVCFLGLMLLLTSGSILAQGLVSDKEAMEGAFPERPYSPPAGRNFPMKVLWGDPEFYGTKAKSEIPMTTQERAYTSPIWYTP